MTTSAAAVLASMFPCPRHADTKITPNTCFHRQRRVVDMVRSIDSPLDPECIGCPEGLRIREGVESGEITLPGKMKRRGRGWANTRIRREAA